MSFAMRRAGVSSYIGEKHCDSLVSACFSILTKLTLLPPRPKEFAKSTHDQSDPGDDSIVGKLPPSDSEDE